MVSNSLSMDQQELIDALRTLAQKLGETPEYVKLRRDLPKEWPI